jgi:hypothetical protein
MKHQTLTQMIYLNSIEIGMYNIKKKNGIFKSILKILNLSQLGIIIEKNITY